MHDFEIIFYEKENGDKPAKEFILSLDTKMKAKVVSYLDVLKYGGNELREPYTKFLGDGIFELRAKHGSDISRILYFFMVGKKIIITNGFIKKAQKHRQRKSNLPKSIVMIIYQTMERSCNYAWRFRYFKRWIDERPWI